MTYSPLILEQFAGIRFDTDPEETGVRGARDAVNVVQRENGLLETRPGYANLPGSAFVGSSELVAMRATPATTDANTHMLVHDGSNTKAVRRSDGTVLATVATGTVEGYANMGTANEWRTFFCDASGGVSWWNGTTFGGPVGPMAFYMAAWEHQRRLVVGNVIGTSASRVQFSDVNDGTTWGASNYIDLTPNDGDKILGITAWEEFLFVFKTKRFFVFYGVSTDSTGGPVFDYRAVDAGVGAASENIQTAISTPDGVYFIAADGVYLTTGGAPRKVSQAIDPLFRPDTSGDTEVFARFGGPTLTPAKRERVELAYLDGVLYLRPAERGTANDLYAYDSRTGSWWRHTLATTLGCFFPLVNDTRKELVLLDGSSKRLITWSPRSTTNTTDQGGSAVAWAYEVGPYRVAEGWDRAVVRQSRVLGSGANVTFQVGTDAGAPTADTGATLSFGAGAWATAYDTRAFRGRQFSVRLSGSGKSTVHRVEHYLR